jgi:hypothetical protein
MRIGEDDYSRRHIYINDGHSLPLLFGFWLHTDVGDAHTAKPTLKNTNIGDSLGK